MASRHYQPATFTLEESPWFKTWSVGRLRAQRETSWFLGLNFGEDQYLLAFCVLTGKDALKNRLSAMFWHHFHTIRAMTVASGRNHLEVHDVREEFSGIFAATPRAASLDSISLAFTIITRGQKVAESGHFGSARPYVVGVDNVVSPANEVILTHMNGRALRYWSVYAGLSGPHVVVQGHDTGNLDSAAVDTVQRRVAANLNHAESSEELHRKLSSMVPEGSLPRCYVAGFLRQGVEAEATLPVLDKAE